MKHIIVDKNVADAFGSLQPDARELLLSLRELIFEVASETDGVGELEETLKWGQPSYLTSKTKSGSTIRLGLVKDEPESVALYFICHTNLVSTFEQIYGDQLRFENNRAIILDVNKPIPETPLSYCIGMALTYHLNKKQT